MQEQSKLLNVALVDQFAMAAVTGLLASRARYTATSTSTQDVAKNAYGIAEEMMCQRLKRTHSRYGKKKDK